MITRVQVKNFRSIASADVSLGPLTVLVGRNGAGKSAFVDVLRFVRDALEHNLEYAFSQRGGIYSVRRWSAGRPYDIEIQLTVDMGIYGSPTYGFVIESTNTSAQFQINREFFQITGGAYELSNFEAQEGKLDLEKAGDFLHALPIYNLPIQPDALILSKLSLINPSPEFRLFLNMVSGETYNIFPNTLRLPQKSLNREKMAEDGANFASVLRGFQESPFFPDLQAALRRVVEGIQDIRVQEAGGYLVVGLQHNDLTNDESENAVSWLGLEQESDGTLRMLAMLTALYKQSSSSFLTLEEPEISLHPGALAVLADVIREASLRRQVIITTQSPDLISRFNADELRVVERVNGATQIGPLDSIQRQAAVDNLFSAGDLLRVEGLRREPDEAVIK